MKIDVYFDVPKNEKTITVYIEVIDKEGKNKKITYNISKSIGPRDKLKLLKNCYNNLCSFLNECNLTEKDENKIIEEMFEKGMDNFSKENYPTFYKILNEKFDSFYEIKGKDIRDNIIRNKDVVVLTKEDNKNLIKMYIVATFKSIYMLESIIDNNKGKNLGYMLSFINSEETLKNTYSNLLDISRSAYLKEEFFSGYNWIQTKNFKMKSGEGEILEAVNQFIVWYLLRYDFNDTFLIMPYAASCITRYINTEISLKRIQYSSEFIKTIELNETSMSKSIKNMEYELLTSNEHKDVIKKVVSVISKEQLMTNDMKYIKKKLNKYDKNLTFSFFSFYMLCFIYSYIFDINMFEFMNKMKNSEELKKILAIYLLYLLDVYISEDDILPPGGISKKDLSSIIFLTKMYDVTMRRDSMRNKLIYFSFNELLYDILRNRYFDIFDNILIIFYRLFDENNKIYDSSLDNFIFFKKKDHEAIKNIISSPIYSYIIIMIIDKFLGRDNNMESFKYIKSYFLDELKNIHNSFMFEVEGVSE